MCFMMLIRVRREIKGKIAEACLFLVQRPPTQAMKMAEFQLDFTA
jgi:hypothetical protein